MTIADTRIQAAGMSSNGRLFASAICCLSGTGLNESKQRTASSTVYSGNNGARLEKTHWSRPSAWRKSRIRFELAESHW